MPVFSLIFLSFAVATQALAPRAPNATCTKHYIVKSGDYCIKIEKANRLSAGTVLSLNSGVVNSACTNLWPGQQICIAIGSTSPSSTSSPPQNTCVMSTVTLPGTNSTTTATVTNTLPAVTVTAAPVTITQGLNATVTITSATTSTVTQTVTTAQPSATYYGCPPASLDGKTGTLQQGALYSSNVAGTSVPVISCGYSIQGYGLAAFCGYVKSTGELLPIYKSNSFSASFCLPNAPTMQTDFAVNKTPCPKFNDAGSTAPYQDPGYTYTYIDGLPHPTTKCYYKTGDSYSFCAYIDGNIANLNAYINVYPVNANNCAKTTA
ncbi:hypothetical protein L218DRAFT_956292 [Marasmius fiardii PR-910]|nr:hypothetical protein L218DRAFT_956292 [Marasmius fiardii PR-910]